MGQMTKCNVKGVGMDKQRIITNPAVALSFTEHFSIFHLVVLVSWPASLLLLFSLPALI